VSWHLFIFVPLSSLVKTVKDRSANAYLTLGTFGLASDSGDNLGDYASLGLCRLVLFYEYRNIGTGKLGREKDLEREVGDSCPQYHLELLGSLRIISPVLFWYIFFIFKQTRLQNAEGDEPPIIERKIRVCDFSPLITKTLQMENQGFIFLLVCN
jgi:hypothetical protein